MFYGQCWKCGERWELGTASTCTCVEKSKREWQGLTDDEKRSLVEWAHPDIIEAIELKLKEKNT
jgi:hypothetical protein